MGLSRFDCKGNAGCQKLKVRSWKPDVEYTLNCSPISTVLRYQPFCRGLTSAPSHCSNVSEVKPRSNEHILNSQSPIFNPQFFHASTFSACFVSSGAVSAGGSTASRMMRKVVPFGELSFRVIL